MFQKVLDWACNCFKKPPRSGVDTVDRCNREAGGFGENPMQGLGCTEPPIGPDGDLPVVDPPQCYGGVGPCDPMPTLFRVAFPCKVPGSTCQTEGYPGGGGGECPPCCPPMCVSFAGYSVGDCVRPPEDRGLIEIKLENCTKCGWYTLSDQLRITIVPPTTGPTGNPKWTLDITLFCGDPLDWPVGHYEADTFDCSEASFAIVSATNSDMGDWQSTISVFPCEGSGTDPATPVPTTCPEGLAMDMYIVPTGPAPLFPPFQDCPTCWIINPSGIADAFGGVSETCCNNLNGQHTLCFVPKQSQGDNLIFGTPCLTSSGVVKPEQCATYEWYSENDITVTGFPCAANYNIAAGVAFAYEFGADEGSCFYFIRHSGQIVYYDPNPLNPITCTDNHDGGAQVVFSSFDDAFWALQIGAATGLLHRFDPGLSPGDRHGAAYIASSVTADSVTFSRVTTDTSYPDSTLVGTWPDEITLKRRGVGFCGPAPYDAQRRLWQLGYNKTAQKWRLESLASIKTPAYELDDATPCEGNEKVLTLVDDGDSGCASAPPTITITRGTDEQCMDCNSYVEPGCQVQLVRECGGTGYALRHTSTVSANPKLSHICAQTRGNDIKQCCDVGCNYTPDTEPDPPCCSVQKVMYSANNDPWFDPGGDVEVWKLIDLDTDPKLVGTFFEGDIVYEVDANGLQCGKTPTQLYLSNDLTTLPDDLKRLYPNNVCMVGDMLKTCNVRYMTPEEEGVDQNFLGGPCNSAGYDPETGHEDFCACNDSCAPVLAGSIVIGTGECIAIVCAARMQVTQIDPDARSRYSYVACARFLTQGVTPGAGSDPRYDTLGQVMYCVGPGNRWACDWYCHVAAPEEVEAHTPRLCLSCVPYLDQYLGTTYANRDACDTLPGFNLPEVNDGGFGGVGYGIEGACACGPPCCGFSVGGEDTPVTLNINVVTSTTPCGTGGSVTVSGDYTSDPVTTDSGGLVWREQSPPPGEDTPGDLRSGANIYATCIAGQWTINCSTINVGDIGSVIVENGTDCPGVLLTGTLRFSDCTFDVTVTL